MPKVRKNYTPDQKVAILRRHLVDFPDSDFSTLGDVFDLKTAAFPREGELTDETLFHLRGDPDALFHMVHHAQLAGKDKLTRHEIGTYPLPAQKAQLIDANRLIAAWLERKPTLADQLHATEAEIDKLLFSASDPTEDEIAIVKLR